MPASLDSAPDLHWKRETIVIDDASLTVHDHGARVRRALAWGASGSARADRPGALSSWRKRPTVILLLLDPPVTVERPREGRLDSAGTRETRDLGARETFFVRDIGIRRNLRETRSERVIMPSGRRAV